MKIEFLNFKISELEHGYCQMKAFSRRIAVKCGKKRSIVVDDGLTVVLFAGDFDQKMSPAVWSSEISFFSKNQASL